MPGIPSTKRGTNPNRLTDKQLMFCLEYLRNGFNGGKAALDAGYKPSTCAAMSCKLLSNGKVRSYIGKQAGEIRDQVKLSAVDAARQIKYLLERNVKDYIDEGGKVVDNLNLLTDAAASCIDGLKQTVRYDDDGNPIYINEIKWSPKATAVDLLLKYVMLADKVEDTREKIDWDTLYERADEEDALEDDVDAEIEGIVQNRIERKEHSREALEARKQRLLRELEELELTAGDYKVGELIEGEIE